MKSDPRKQVIRQAFCAGSLIARQFMRLPSSAIGGTQIVPGPIVKTFTRTGRVVHEKEGTNQDILDFYEGNNRHLPTS